MKTFTIGTNRNRPRIWLQGDILKGAGFNKGDKFNIENQPNRLIITRAELGARTVSGKLKAGAYMPIIDLAGAVIERSFDCKKIEAVNVRKLRDGRLEITPA